MTVEWSTPQLFEMAAEVPPRRCVQLQVTVTMDADSGQLSGGWWIREVRQWRAILAGESLAYRKISDLDECAAELLELLTRTRDQLDPF